MKVGLFIPSWGGPRRSKSDISFGIPSVFLLGSRDVTVAEDDGASEASAGVASRGRCPVAGVACREGDSEEKRSCPWCKNRWRGPSARSRDPAEPGGVRADLGAAAAHLWQRGLSGGHPLVLRAASTPLRGTLRPCRSGR